MTAVRLYGVSNSNASFGRVAAGIREGLEDLGAFAGFVPIDDIEDGAIYAGARAPVAIFTGPPNMVTAMASHGEHERCYAVLAPNSEWLPERLLEQMVEYAEIVAPSSWGAEIVERYTGKHLPPYRHGVSKGFSPAPSNLPLVQAYDDGQFRVLHLSSTDRARKGTAELVEAWCLARQHGWLGRHPKLHLIVDAPAGTYPLADAEETIDIPHRHLNLPIEKMRAFYQDYHLVCQPSRGEGFGMCPLEARACGIPVCATRCTGHADHVTYGGDEGDVRLHGGLFERERPYWKEPPGVVYVPSFDNAPIDDAPDPRAVAPALDVEVLAQSLAVAYKHWKKLEVDARAAADDIRAQWSWRSTTEQWLRKVGIEWSSKTS